MDRRMFLRSARAALGLSLLPIGSRGWAAVADSTSATVSPRLIVVMLRGAIDGLSVVVPYGEPEYYRARSSIAIARPGQEFGVSDLDGHFGLHPALSPLIPLWSSRRLAFVHASGSPDPSRSHFDAQDYLESGTPGLKSTADGWMNRLLGVLVDPHARIEPGTALSLGPTPPRILSGPRPVSNVPLGRAASRADALDRPEVGKAFAELYGGDDGLSRAYREGRATHTQVMTELSDPVSNEADVADGGAPPAKGFAADAIQLARLVRNPSLRLAFLSVGGWDTHVGQGGAKPGGVLGQRLGQLGNGLSTLATQLGPELDRTVILVMSEFGRTVRENGNRGTDHGHGNVMWLMGGGLAGGKVHGDWPSIDESARYESRDLAITTDYRSVLQVVCERHLRVADRNLASVFPQAPPVAAALTRLVGTSA